MKISIFKCLLILFIVMFGANSVLSQSITLRLDTLSQLGAEPMLVDYPQITQVWAKNDSLPIDSVRYTYSLESDYFQLIQSKEDKRKQDKFNQLLSKCPDVPLELNILIRKESGQTRFCLLTRYNSFLEKDIILSYESDSLKKWNKQNTPKSSGRILVEFPFCIDNEIKNDKMEIYPILYFNEFTYSDPRLQEFQLSMSTTKIRKSKFMNFSFFVKKDNYLSPEKESIQIIVEDENNIRVKSKDFRAKDHFVLGDTIVLGDLSYVIDSISQNWDSLYLQNLGFLDKKVYLPEDILNELKAYFKNSPYLLIDFWGTWCVPCIQGLPKLKILYELTGDKCEFVSVCFDKSENFTKAIHIFEEQGISWSQIFDDQNNAPNTLSRRFNVNSFPTYILINKDGEVLFRDGSKGFNSLTDLLGQ